MPKNESRGARMCANCGKNRAGFFKRGRWVWDEDHDLCQRCYRAARGAY
jgi:hypothetical protein